MDIPESINKLTTEIAPSQIVPLAAQETYASIEPVANAIRQNTEPSDYKAFEEGAAFYKQSITQDRNFLKNFLNVYIDAVSKSINTSSVSDDIKSELIKMYTNAVKGVASNIEAIHTLANTLNKDQNIIDVRKISYIMLGYAIDTIKKYNDIRNRSQGS
jgi:hypothetical protein